MNTEMAEKLVPHTTWIVKEFTVTMQSEKQCFGKVLVDTGVNSKSFNWHATRLAGGEWKIGGEGAALSNGNRTDKADTYPFMFDALINRGLKTIIGEELTIRFPPSVSNAHTTPSERVAGNGHTAHIKTENAPSPDSQTSRGFPIPETEQQVSREGSEILSPAEALDEIRGAALTTHTPTLEHVSVAARVNGTRPLERPSLPQDKTPEKRELIRLTSVPPHKESGGKAPLEVYDGLSVVQRRIALLHKEGCTPDEILKKVGCSHATAYRQLGTLCELFGVPDRDALRATLLALPKDRWEVLMAFVGEGGLEKTVPEAIVHPSTNAAPQTKFAEKPKLGLASLFAEATDDEDTTLKRNRVLTQHIELLRRLLAPKGFSLDYNVSVSKSGVLGAKITIEEDYRST